MTGKHLYIAPPDKRTAWIEEPLLLQQQVSDGSWDAYTRLFDHYLPKLYQYIFPLTGESRQDTEDLIQEIFLMIWEKRETLMAIRSFDHYLFRMARNKLIDMLRKNNSGRSLQAQYSSMKEKFHTEPEKALEFTEYRTVAIRAIAKLSPKLQSVFIMSTQEELSLDEISRQLGLSKETVKKRLYLATTFIKAYLKKNAGWLMLLLWEIT